MRINVTHFYYPQNIADSVNGNVCLVVAFLPISFRQAAAPAEHTM